MYKMRPAYIDVQGGCATADADLSYDVTVGLG
jgi:hypothetical protein